MPLTHVFAHRSTDWVELPLTSPMPATDIARVMAQMRIEAITSDLDVQFGYRTSSDMMSWGSVVALGDNVSTDGLHYVSNSTPIDDVFVEFLVRVRNKSAATACASALVSLQLELSSF